MNYIAAVIARHYNWRIVNVACMSHKVKRLYEFGPFRLDATERMLLRNGRLVPLKPKVFDLLLTLVENAGRILGKDELMGLVWADSFVEEGNLAVGVFNLRRILGRRRNGLPYIETLSRRGYRFVAQVKEISDAAPGPLAAGGGSIVRGDLRGIAVLPFKTIGAGPVDEYLGLGLADALITKLSNIKQIAVRPTTAVRKYVGADDPVIAGRELNVMTVLDGSIQKADKEIRVTVQLIDVHDGSSLWAEKYDEQFTNIFALEDSISEQVTGALTLKLTGEEKRLLSKRYTENTEAYSAYLRGRYFLSGRTPEGFKKAIECFEQAILVDPYYAPAYSGLADCYNLLVAYNALPLDYCMPRAKKAVLKALELDDKLAEAHASLAHIKAKFEWDWMGAEKEFKRAIELNPNYSVAHHWYSLTLKMLGRLDEALAEIKCAQELDPLSLIINATVASCYYFRREYDEAIKQVAATLELDPDFSAAHFCRGMTLEAMKMYEESCASYEKAMSLIGRHTEILSCLGHTYAMAGRINEARALLGELKSMSLQSEVSYYAFALIHAALGEKDEALNYLERGYEQHSENLVMINVDPKLDSLRDDPRFKCLVRRVGLAGTPANNGVKQHQRRAD